MKALDIERLKAWRAALTLPDLERIESQNQRLIRLNAISGFIGLGLVLVHLSLVGAVLLILSVTGWTIAAVLGLYIIVKNARAMWKLLTRQVTEDKTFAAIEQIFAIWLSDLPEASLQTLLSRRKRLNGKARAFFWTIIVPPANALGVFQLFGHSPAAVLSFLFHSPSFVIGLGMLYIVGLFIASMVAQRAQRDIDVLNEAIVYGRNPPGEPVRALRLVS